jgi:hypothetical protein
MKAINLGEIHNECLAPHNGEAISGRRFADQVPPGHNRPLMRFSAVEQAIYAPSFWGLENSLLYYRQMFELESLWPIRKCKNYSYNIICYRNKEVSVCLIKFEIVALDKCSPSYTTYHVVV